MAASTLLLNSAYKTSVFSEINPVPLGFFSLKIVSMERSSDSQILKKSYVRFSATSVSMSKYLHILVIFSHKLLLKWLSLIEYIVQKMSQAKI